MAHNASLSQQLTNLINPEPAFEDPEDDGNIDAANKWFHNAPEQSGDSVETSAFSKIRKKQVSLLSSANKRYIGKKINRSDLEGEGKLNSSPSEIEAQSENGEFFEEDEEYDEDNEESGSELSQAQSELESEDDYELEDAGAALSDELDGEINIVNIDSEKQISKANAVRNQLVIYDNLLETRIKMQKLLSSSNRLLQGTNYQSVKKSDSTLLSNLLEDCSKGLRKLGKFLCEIDGFVDCGDQELSRTKRKSSSFDEETLSKRFCHLANGYRPIIDSWHERTKFANANVKLKKFESFEVCPTKSIDQILTDKDRLIRRTRVMRTQYKIIGELQLEANETSYNEQIYDDDDFYHQLLRQIIENKMGDLDDSTAMSKKYIEIQRMRNKLKKKQVDTRASKGRKIRYDVHEKLVNFMAPVDKSTLSEEAKSELFRSLFGNFNSSQL